jgi:hypothetical protein
MGRFFGSVTEKVFDNYGCRFAFRAPEPVETCEFFLSSYGRFSKEWTVDSHFHYLAVFIF